MKVDTNIMLDVLLKTKEGKKFLLDSNDDNRNTSMSKDKCNEMPKIALSSTAEQNNGCLCNCWWQNNF